MDEPFNLTRDSIARLLRYLDYPEQWSLEGLYPEELARIQLAEILRKLGITGDVFVQLPPDRSYGPGSEHFRAAAISYWLRRPRSPEVTNALKAALRSDPDRPMANAFFRELEGQAL
jgi:hypothetical protein